MVEITTKLMPRADLATFLPSPRAIKAFEDAQSDIQASGDVITAIQTAPLLSIAAVSTLTGARVLSLGTDLAGVDGGPSGLYELSLKPTGVAAGAYGGNQAWPTFTVDVKGRLSAAAALSFTVSLPLAYDAPTRTFSFTASARLLPAGGTTGQVLTKTTATDYDVGWTTPSGGGGGGTAATNWSNGIGNRSFLIGSSAVSCSGPLASSLGNAPVSGFFFNGGTGPRSVLFQFPAANIVDGFGVFSSTTTANGIWTFEGSPDNVTWTTITSSFTIGGTPYYPFLAAPPASAYVATLTNTTAYVYYRLSLNTGQSSSSTPYINWFIFRCQPI
jgi:hypothetical protein